MNKNQITGNIGLFYACYYLSWLGWNAMPTVRNAEGPDVFLHDEECEVLGIQVKSFSKNTDIPLGKNFLNKSTQYWVVMVNVRADGKHPDSFIVPSEDIRKSFESGSNTNEDLVYFDEKNGEKTYYLNRRFFRKGSKYAEAWDEYLARDKHKR